MHAGAEAKGERSGGIRRDRTRSGIGAQGRVTAQMRFAGGGRRRDVDPCGERKQREWIDGVGEHREARILGQAGGGTPFRTGGEEALVGERLQQPPDEGRRAAGRGKIGVDQREGSRNAVSKQSGRRTGRKAIEAAQARATQGIREIRREWTPRAGDPQSSGAGSRSRRRGNRRG
ncbi:hypothetical protein ACFQWF_21410 [Methylorubrum suomiense]